MFDVITIGSATKDNYLISKFKLIDWPETPLKKAIVLPFGEKMGVDDIYSTVGGNAVNASITFARQGFKTACAAKLGVDAAAEELKSRLKKEGVNTKLIAYSKNTPTAYSVLLLVNGERTILGYYGASNTLTLEDWNFKKLKSKWWYLSLSGESDKIFRNLINFAKENNIKIAFNPTGHHIKHKRQEILEALKDIAFLVLNESEAAELTGISFENPLKAFQTLDEWTPGIVAVTRGDRGVTVSDGKFIYTAGIFKDQTIIDRTGAGDAFGGGFVSGLIHREKLKKGKDEAFDLEDIKYATRLASANATSVVETLGASEGALTKEKFDREPRWRDFEIEARPL
ncbi:MAG: carbohydrate kinase family protein [Patescibacteria group bacterium]